MISPLKIGAVLVQGNPVIPDSVCVQREPFCSDWQAITNLTGDELDRQLRNDGWNFIFIAGALRGTSWGSWSGAAVRCAAIRVLKKSLTAKLNAFEITGIVARRFLGVPYVVVTGHSRHLQKSTVLQNIAERIHQGARAVPSSLSEGVSVAPVAATAVAK